MAGLYVNVNVNVNEGVFFGKGKKNCVVFGLGGNDGCLSFCVYV